MASVSEEGEYCVSAGSDTTVKSMEMGKSTSSTSSEEPERISDTPSEGGGDDDDDIEERDPFVDLEQYMSHKEELLRQRREEAVNIGGGGGGGSSSSSTSSPSERDEVTRRRDVRITAARRTRGGKKIRDKRHACWFCQKTFQSPARHYKSIHRDELPVAKLLAWPKNSRKRRDGFADLNRAGDFAHNCEALTAKDGELILVRRPTVEEAKVHRSSDYGPCPNCLGFMLKKHLWHHMRDSCTKKRKSLVRGELVAAAAAFEGDGEEGETSPSSGAAFRNKHVIAESNAILNEAFGEKFNEDFNGRVLSRLREDAIGKCCREDNLIVRMGAVHYEKRGFAHEEETRQKMRQMARLVLRLRETAAAATAHRGRREEAKLGDFIRPDMFDEVVAATRTITPSKAGAGEGEKDDREAAAAGSRRRDGRAAKDIDAPSLRLKIGFGLRTCANILRGSALRKNDLEADRRITSFLQLMELEWANRVSSNALSVLRNRKLNVPQLLPLTEDLVRLATYLDDRLEHYRKLLSRDAVAEEESRPSTSSSSPSSSSSAFTPHTWLRFAGYLLCRIILFNKRRSGEAAGMTVDNYAARPMWSEQGTQELQSTFTPFERALAEKLAVVVEIVGKRGGKVAVILTASMKTAVDLLLKSRRRCGINADNPYVFATSGERSTSHLRGHDCLRRVCGELTLEHPDHITGTKLRKYVATVCQLFDLRENETDWLARHLGHDIRVHRQFYRLHESAVELTKISRLLLAIDKGEAGKYAGKTLEEINNDDLPPVEEEGDGGGGDEDDDDDYHEEDVESDEGEQPRGTKEASPLPPPSPVRTPSPSPSPPPPPRPPRRPRNGKRKRFRRRAWRSRERKVVTAFFRINLRRGILPGKMQCVECLEKYPKVLAKRKWTDLKYFVKNALAKVKTLKK